MHGISALSATELADGLVWDRTPALRLAVGGQNRASVADGEWWRLCTSTLLHGNLLHLSLNALALWVLGRMLEPWVGPLRWLSIFALGGLAGSLASQLAWVRMSDGASGGAFALLGATLVIGWRVRPQLDEDERRLYGPILAGFLALNICTSLALSFVDAWGHLGGLLAGLVLGAIIAVDRPTTLPERVGWGGLLALFSGICAWGWLQP